MERCENCRYRGRTSLEEPCSTGMYQLFYSGRCFCHKPLRWWQRVFDRITKGRGPQEGV